MSTVCTPSLSLAVMPNTLSLVLSRILSHGRPRPADPNCVNIYVLGTEVCARSDQVQQDLLSVLELGSSPGHGWGHPAHGTQAAECGSGCPGFTRLSPDPDIRHFLGRETEHQTRRRLRPRPPPETPLQTKLRRLKSFFQLCVFGGFFGFCFFFGGG